MRYHSTHSEEAWTSLDQYVERMSADQDQIYYVIGDSLASARRSPHLDPFKARNLEVLYWSEPLDVFLAPMLPEYRDKHFRNVADAGLELPADEAAPEAALEPLTPEADFNRFVGRCVTTLGIG